MKQSSERSLPPRKKASAVRDVACLEDIPIIGPAIGADLRQLGIFIAAVRYMAGEPKKPWWKYTAERKRELAARTSNK